MSRDHVFRGGPNYTILSLSGRGMSLMLIDCHCNDCLLPAWRINFFNFFNNLFLDWRYLGPFLSSALAKWKIDRNWGFGPQIFNEGSLLPPQKKLAQISKTTPIFNLLSYRPKGYTARCCCISWPQYINWMHARLLQGPRDRASQALQESLANAKVNVRQNCVSLSCLCNSLTQIEWVVQLLLPPKHAKSRKIPR